MELDIKKEVKIKRAALCFSGHLRDFSLCYDSLHMNFIQPLINAGFHVDTFAVFWDVLGHRNSGWIGNVNFEYFKDKMKPKSLIVKEFNRNKFIKDFSSDQWKLRTHLSGSSTSSDATSMWYTIYTCLEQLQKYQLDHNFTYDIVCRTRPDLIYSSPLNIVELTDILNQDVIYIPSWRGKYYEICREMVDYFGIGNYKVMSHYMSTFLNIPLYLSSNLYIHTAEGYLLAQLKDYTIKRTIMQFCIQRDNYIENVMS